MFYQSNDHNALEKTALETAASSDFGASRVVYLVNDSETTPIQFNFDRAIGERGTFTLLPGEFVSDLERRMDKVFYKGVGGSAPFRMLGLQ